jgi:hypothetical protein
LRVVGGLVDIGAYEYHEYQFCDVNTLTLDNEVMDSGGDNYSSEVGIDTNGTVIISSGADVVLTAPVIQLNPGFRVESGAQLLIRDCLVNNLLIYNEKNLKIHDHLPPCNFIWKI